MFKKLLTIFLLLVLAASAAPKAHAAQGVTLNLWIMPNGSRPAEYIEAELKAFQEANPGITVKHEILDWGSAYTRLTNAAISGEGADVTQLGTTWTGAIDALDALYHFTDEDLTPLGGRSNFTPAALNTVLRADNTNNAMIAMPWFAEARAVLYRRDIFEQLKIDAKEAFSSWENFRAALRKIKDAKLTVTDTEGKTFPVAPIAFPGKNDWNVLHNFAPWVWGAGGDLLSKDLKTATFNDKTSLEGIKFYASLYTDGLTPTDSLELNSAQIDGLFQQGRVAMVISGPWLVSTSRRNLDNGGWIDPNAKTSIWPDALAVAEIPAGPAGRFTFVGGGDLGVFKHTKHLKESIKLAQFLASDASQLRYTQATGFLPVTKTALANKVYNEDEDFKVFVSAISSGRSYPTIASWGPLETVFVANLGALWDDVAGVNGKFDPDKQIPDRLEKLATEVNSTIKNQSSP